MKARKIEEGTALVAEGDKHCSSGFFKKPQWELAAQSYKKAAVAFKVAKEPKRCAEAHLKAAEAYGQSGSRFHAAQSLEGAATMTEDVLRKAQLMEQASEMYRENGTHDKGALLLQQAGEHLMKHHQLDEAERLLREAASVVEGPTPRTRPQFNSP